MSPNPVVTWEEGSIGGAYAIDKDTKKLFAINAKSDYLNNRSTRHIREVKGGNGSSKIKSWGDNNRLPTDIAIDMLDAMGLPSLLNTKQKILLGQGELMFWTERIVKDEEKGDRIVKDRVLPSAEIVEFHRRSGGWYGLMTAFSEMVKHGNLVVEYVPYGSQASKNFGKVHRLAFQEAKFYRKEEIAKSGVSEHVYFDPAEWAGKATEQSPRRIKTMSVWDEIEPLTENKIVWLYNPLFVNDNYYSEAVWWNALRWKELLNIVPKFHLANLKNRFFPSWHIRIRKGMFLNRATWETADEETRTQLKKDADEARKKFLGDVVNTLSGAENAGNVIFSEEELMEVAKQFPDVEILALPSNINDEALLKLYDEAMKTIMGAAQVHPTLANIETAGKLSSGSEMQNAALIQRVIHAPEFRNMVLACFLHAYKINGWDIVDGKQLHVGFVDADIVVRSEEKSGVKQNFNGEKND